MKKAIIGLFILMNFAMPQAWAADVNVILDSSDGSTGMVIKNSNLASVATYDSAGAIAARTVYGSGQTYNLGAGAKFLWYPKKAAFRAGNTTGAEWNDASIGGVSAAFGNNTVATGGYSLATGAGTTASGNYSTALGFSTVASSDDAVSMGSSTTASGPGSVALGYNINNSTPYSLGIGYSGSGVGKPSILLSGEGNSYFNSNAGSLNIGTKDALALIRCSVWAPSSGGAIIGFTNTQCYGALGFPSYGVYANTTQGGYGVYSDASGPSAVGVYGKGALTGVEGYNNSSGGTAVKATQSGAGFALQSTGGVNYLDGDTGIGTSNPANYKLHVTDTLASGFVAIFENLDTGTNGDGIRIQIGPTANPGAGNHFISFRDGDGTEIGSVKGTGAASVNYSTVGGDYAEYFDAEEDVPPGGLVGLNLLSGKARALREGDPLMGIVSIAPGFTGNTYNSDSNKKKVLIALVGQVDIKDLHKIKTDNGVVKTTDGQKIGYLLANGKVFIKY